MVANRDQILDHHSGEWQSADRPAGGYCLRQLADCAAEGCFDPNQQKIELVIEIEADSKS